MPIRLEILISTLSGLIPLITLASILGFLISPSFSVIKSNLNLAFLFMPENLAFVVNSLFWEIVFDSISSLFIGSSYSISTDSTSFDIFSYLFANVI